MHMPVPAWDWGTAGPRGIRPTGKELPASASLDTPATLLSDDVSLSFERHIRPIFRPMNRQSMRVAFEPWWLTDTSRHAAGILTRLLNGPMPYDATWPAEQMDVFKRWVEAGMPEQVPGLAQRAVGVASQKWRGTFHSTDGTPRPLTFGACRSMIFGLTCAIRTADFDRIRARTCPPTHPLLGRPETRSGHSPRLVALARPRFPRP